MLFLMLLLILVKMPCYYNAGSSIFYKRFSGYSCWREDEIAKLRARRVFEQLLPPPVAPENLNSVYVKEILNYFHKALRTVGNNEDKTTSMILKEALADTIGSHLRSELLPSSRFAYYSGYIPYAKVKELHDFYDRMKIFLNTQGLGWKKPESVPKWANLTVEKIRIGPGRYIDPCSSLIVKRDSKSCIHLPPLKLDNSCQPTALALPFREGGLVSLESSNSENALLKYYTTASRCILRNSPDNCRHNDFVSFHNELWHWLKRDVAPHLVDEKLYAAYGGVLRIAAAVQSYGKGLSRRNLFMDQLPEAAKWHPWKTLTDSYIYVTADVSPYMYILIIFMIGIAICLLQIAYGYMFGDSFGCHCKSKTNWFGSSREVAYTTVDSNIPALLHSPPSARKCSIVTNSKTKTSFGSIKNQKVYDMNDNKEKTMAVIMSDSEDSDDESFSHSKITSVSTKVAISKDIHAMSPPKIETSITEISCTTKPKITQSHLGIYSTSTATNSALTYQQRATESWSGSGSSTSAQSASSISSKSIYRRSRDSRDLAWARRLASRHAMNSKSTSVTEIDVNSFTTPPSKGQ